MKKLTKVFPILFFFVFSLIVSSIGWAQAGGGALKGTIVDDSDKFPLPTVKIAVVGTKIYGTTNTVGEFFVEDIPAGVYKVTFELAGYLIEIIKEVTITSGQTTQLDVTLKMGFAHELTVTARREKINLQQVPQNVEVLTSTELEDMPVLDLAFALNNMTGVDVSTGSGLTTLGTFMSINGYDDIYIKKMVDGVDIGEVVSNWSMLNSYPEEMLEQIEVVKGGASSVWGANMGGIINLITKRPTNLVRPVVRLKGQFSVYGEMDFANADALPNLGTNNLQKYSTSIMGNLQDFFYMVGYANDTFDGFTDYSKEENYNIFAKFGYNFNKDTYVDFLYSYNKLGSSIHTFLTTAAPPGYDYEYNYKQDSVGKSQMGSIKFFTLLNPKINLEAQLKFNKYLYSGTTEYLEGNAPYMPPDGTITESLFTDQKLGFTIKSSYMPVEDFSLIGGVDYYRIKADYTFITDQPVIYVNSWAPFVNADLRIGSLGIHAGARYDYDSSFGNQVSPSFGVNLNLLPATIIRANIARTFKVPPQWYTIGESYMNFIMPNPDLFPERAWNYSFGFESQELHYVWVKVSLYYDKMTDGIVTVASEEYPGRLTWGNLNKFVRKGYSGELGFITPFGLTGYIGTNFNKHENVTADVRLSWMPTRSYKTGLKYKNKKLDFMANLRGRWIWWNEEDSPWAYDLFLPEDKKWVFDLRVSKGFNIMENTRLGVFIDIYNVTNQIHWDRLDFPNPKRWIVFGFELKFD